MSGNRRTLVLGGAAAGALLAAVLVSYPRAPSRPRPQPEQRATEAPQRQRDFTPTPGEAARAALADAEARARSRETPTKLAPVPEAPGRSPSVRADLPRPSGR